MTIFAPASAHRAGLNKENGLVYNGALELWTPTQKYLHDIQLAPGRIGRFCGGRNFTDYLADEILSSAVERQLGIVGEALSRLAKEVPGIAAAYPSTAGSLPFEIS